jgi:4'-phosphopantetheinyl transferase
MLGAGDVHIWWLPLNCTPAQLDVAARLLSPDEAERVARFRFAHLREHAAAARGLLRTLLARYLSCDPATLRFEYGPQGKPRLADKTLQFNLAHSAGLAVCGISLDLPLGVDVELIRPDIDHAGIAEHSFSPNERARLSVEYGFAAVRGFFRCWTLKEAYIKARGGGLSIPLESFDVPLDNAEDTPRQVVSRDTTPEAQGWYARELAVDGAFAAAVAARAPMWRVLDCGSIEL